MSKSFIEQLKELYAYREMVAMLVRRDLRGKYKKSVLGLLWTFINPLLQLLVYTFVFSVVLKAGIDKYYLFLFVALVPWMFMASAVTAGSTCVVSQASMVSKIYFPRMVLPISHVTTCFVNMLLCFVVVLAVCGFSIGFNFVALLYLIPVMLIEYILAIGLVLIVSSITVYLRDMEYILGILVMAWQFLTPIMYSESSVPESIIGLFRLNPMTSIIIAYRSILYYKAIPDFSTMLSAIICGVVFLVFGWALFNKLQKHFAEEM